MFCDTHEQLQVTWLPLKEKLKYISIKLASLAALCKESACQCRRWVWSLGGKIPWRRKQQLTPVFLPKKSHGQRSLVGYSSWGCRRDRHDLETKQQQGIKCETRHTPFIPGRTPILIIAKDSMTFRSIARKLRYLLHWVPMSPSESIDLRITLDY